MRTALGEAPIPDHRDDGLAMLSTAWEDLTGFPFATRPTPQLKRHDHGGLSGGL